MNKCGKEIKQCVYSEICMLDTTDRGECGFICRTIEY